MAVVSQVTAIGMVTATVVVAVIIQPAIYAIRNPGPDLFRALVGLRILGVSATPAVRWGSLRVLELGIAVTIAVLFGLPLVVCWVGLVIGHTAARVVWITRPTGGERPTWATMILRWRVVAKQRRVFEHAGVVVARTNGSRATPTLAHPIPLRDGVGFTVTLPGGLDRERFRGFAPGLASSIAGLAGVTCTHVEIPKHPRRVRGANRAEMTVWADNPRRHPQPWPTDWWPHGPTFPTSTLTVPVGVDGMGDIVTAPVEWSHWLLGGATRFGKSQLMRTSLMSMLGLATQGLPLAVIDIDLGGGEIRHTHRIANLVATQPPQAGRILQLIDEVELPRRRDYITTAAATSMGSPEAPYTDEFPFLVLRIDEADLIFRSGTDEHQRAGQQRGEWLASIVKRSAKLGVHVELGTQHALIQSGVFSSTVRSQLTWTACCFAQRPEDAETIIGGFDRTQPNPTSLDPTADGTRGQFFSREGDGDLRWWKAFHVDDATLAAAVEHAHPHIGSLPLTRPQDA